MRNVGFLAASRACEAIFWTAPRFRTFGSSGFSAEGRVLSLSVVPQCGCNTTKSTLSPLYYNQYTPCIPETPYKYYALIGHAFRPFVVCFPNFPIIKKKKKEGEGERDWCMNVWNGGDSCKAKAETGRESDITQHWDHCCKRACHIERETNQTESLVSLEIETNQEPPHSTGSYHETVFL